MEEAVASEVDQVAQEDIDLLRNDRVDRRDVVGVKVVVEKCAVSPPLQSVRHARHKPIEAHADTTV